MMFRILAACALACALASAAASTADAQEQKVSGAERDAYAKIDKAKGAEAKLQAAAEFVKKYPASPLRSKAAETVAKEIEDEKDAAQKIALAETYVGFFNTPEEAERVNRPLIAAYIDANRPADAFKLAQVWLEKHPDDADIFTRLTILASNKALADDMAYSAQGQQFGAKAIELIEADKRPTFVDAEQWATFKTATLPALYRATGIIALKAGDRAAARERLEKAIALKLDDPAVFLVLVDLTNDEYNALARQYNSAPAGPQRDAMLKQVNDSLDRVIEATARALARVEGNPQLQPAYEQLKSDLESSYKRRHNNSTEGMQQLVNKYKKQ